MQGVLRVERVLAHAVHCGDAPEEDLRFCHVFEKLSPAAEVMVGRDGKTALPERWKPRLRNSDGAAARILDELRASGLEQCT